MNNGGGASGRSSSWTGVNQFIDYAWKVILSSPSAVFIPRGHPLFDKEISSFSDFREHPFILLNPKEYPKNYEYLMTIAKKHGFTPKIATGCLDTSSAKYNLSMGKELYLVSDLFSSEWENENIRKFSLLDAPCVDLLLVWKKKYMKLNLTDCINSASCLRLASWNFYSG